MNAGPYSSAGAPGRPGLETPEDDNDHQNEDEKKDRTDTAPDRVKEYGAITLQGAKGALHCITIIGHIEGHQVLPSANKTTKYEHIMPTLASIEESPDIEGLLVLLNTVGGDVEAGLAIAELIASMKKPTVSLVLGGGHSIGVPLAVAADVSFIVPSAGMTIHPVRLSGVIIGAPQTYSYFDKIQERIVAFVEAHSGIPREVFTGYMLRTGELAADVGSVIYGEEAVACGLIKRLGGLKDALSCLHGMIDGGKESGVTPPPS